MTKRRKATPIPESHQAMLIYAKHYRPGVWRRGFVVVHGPVTEYGIKPTSEKYFPKHRRNAARYLAELIGIDKSEHSRLQPGAMYPQELVLEALRDDSRDGTPGDTGVEKIFWSTKKMPNMW